MKVHDMTPRYLGAAFLGVIVTSLVSGVATEAAIGPASSISDTLANAATNAGTLRIAVLAGLCNAVGILILATLLYVVLEGQGRTLAIVALLCWVGEAIFYALNQVAVSGLIRLGSDYVAAGAPVGSFHETLGQFLYHDVYELGGTILMFFYCAGGLLWYSLFYRSRYVPRPLALFGLAAVTLGLLGAGIELLGTRLQMLPYLAIGVFELAIGVLLVVRGIDEGHGSRSSVSAPAPAGR